jgi:hypothetical protein
LADVHVFYHCAFIGLLDLPNTFNVKNGFTVEEGESVVLGQA